MKRKIAMLLCILLPLMLCSCAAKEPEAPAETENTIVEINRDDTGEDTNKLAASAVAYTDSFQSADGSVNVEINLEDTSLYEGSFRTLQITPRPFTEEEVQHIANVLFGDAVLYEYINNREATKTELLEQREVLETLLEGDALMEMFNTEDVDDEKEIIRSYLDTHKVEDAPESVERTVCEFQYKPWDCYHNNAPGLTSEGYLEISAQTEVEGIPYRFGAVNNTNNGVRVYRIDAFVANEIIWPLGVGEIMACDEILGKEEPKQEQIDAVREKAEKMIAAMDMGKWQIDSCEVSKYGDRYAIEVKAVPVYNGIPMLRQAQLSYLRGTEEGIQNCYNPELNITFSPDGTLYYFEMVTPVDITAAGEEGKTMSFAELMGSIKTRFSQTSATDLPDGNRYADAVVSDIQLGYAMVPANSGDNEHIQLPGVNGDTLVVNNSDFVLIPAVTVYGNYQTYLNTPEENAFDYRKIYGREALFAVLNASNGSMIAPANSNMILG